MDLDDAIQKHFQWKATFRNAIHENGSLDAAAISKATICELGRWLHGEAAALYGKSPYYTKCVAAHAAFHLVAGKVAEAVNAKDTSLAERLLADGSSFSEASKRVGLAIEGLKKEFPG